MIGPGPKSKLAIPEKASDINKSQIDSFRSLKSARLKLPVPRSYPFHLDLWLRGGWKTETAWNKVITLTVGHVA